eukprot:gene37593-50751_t
MLRCGSNRPPVGDSPTIRNNQTHAKRHLAPGCRRWRPNEVRHEQDTAHHRYAQLFAPAARRPGAELGRCDRLRAAGRRVGAVHPGLWEALGALVYGQLRLNVQAVAELVALKPRERLISRLAQLSAQGDGQIAIAQADLAEMIGVTRKAVNGWLSVKVGWTVAQKADHLVE